MVLVSAYVPTNCRMSIQLTRYVLEKQLVFCATVYKTRKSVTVVSKPSLLLLIGDT